MRAILRRMAVLVLAGPWLASGPVLAQESLQQVTTNKTAPTAVGPSELQNFSLSGSVSKPSEQPAPAPASKPAQASAATEPSVSPDVRSTPKDRPARRQADASIPTTVRAAPAKATPRAAPLAPPAEAASLAKDQPAPASATRAQSVAPAVTLAPERRIAILPWIFAALALVGGTVFLLWLRRPREALAGAEFDLFSAPQPAPVPERDAVPPPVPDPRPTPEAPEKRSAPEGFGIVASRLRPSLELGVQPLRCVVEEGQITIEFEVELFNAGTAPARAVLAEASLLNAGATQDQELAAFFASPVGIGERLDAIPPMRRINLTSRVVAPRGAIQEYELAGRKAFVPVIAFNALYEWSGGKAQTSAAYLVGRETRSEKLGPLHLDQGERAFTTLAARELPSTVRT